MNLEWKFLFEKRSRVWLSLSFQFVVIWVWKAFVLEQAASIKQGSKWRVYNIFAWQSTTSQDQTFNILLQTKAASDSSQLSELIIRGQFHQRVYVQLLCAQIPKVQKASWADCLFALFGFLRVKAACKHIDEIDPCSRCFLYCGKAVPWNRLYPPSPPLSFCFLYVQSINRTAVFFNKFVNVNSGNLCFWRLWFRSYFLTK